MRITAPVTDYVRESIFTTAGDLAVRDGGLVQRLPAGIAGTYLQGKGAVTLPKYEKTMPPLTTRGDLIVQGGALPERLAGGDTGFYLQSRGVGAIPIYKQTMPPLTSIGDLIEQGSTIPLRFPSGAAGSVLESTGVGNWLQWTALFSLLTTQGDLWVRGAADPQRIAAGLLDTYLKGQGAGELPIYEKMALRDTGVHIGNSTRDAAGDQAIAGVGFQPSIVIFLTTDHTTTNQNWSVGFDDGTVHQIMYRYENGTFVGEIDTASLRIFRAVTDLIYGSITTLGGDGFTITWSLIGACDCDFIYLCLP